MPFSKIRRLYNYFMMDAESQGADPQEQRVYARKQMVKLLRSES